METEPFEDIINCQKLCLKPSEEQKKCKRQSKDIEKNTGSEANEKESIQNRRSQTPGCSLSVQEVGWIIQRASSVTTSAFDNLVCINVVAVHQLASSLPFTTPCAFERKLDIPRKSPNPISNPSLPPILLIWCPLRNRHNLSLLEAQIRRLFCLKREQCNCLVRLQLILGDLRDELRFRRGWTGWFTVTADWRRTIRAVVVSAGVEAVERDVGVGAGGEGAVDACGGGVGGAVVDVVLPGAGALRLT